MGLSNTIWAGGDATSGEGGSGGGVIGAGVDFHSMGELLIGAGSSITGNVATGGAGGTPPAGHAVGVR